MKHLNTSGRLTCLSASWLSRGWKPVWLLGLLLSVTLSVQAQTPQYKKQLGTTASTTFHLGSTSARKTQQLYTASDLGAAGASGNITSIFFRNSAANATATYTDFNVRLGHTSNTTFTSTAPATTNLNFYGGLTTVLSVPSLTLTGNATAGGWFEIPLSTPFLYNNSQTLIVEIEFASLTGSISVIYSTGPSAPAHKKLYSSTVGAATGTAYTLWPDFGMNLTASTPCTSPPAAGNAASSLVTVCAGQNFTLTLIGNSSGTGQTYQWQSSPTGAAGTFTNISGATQASFTTSQSVTTYYRANVTCSGSTVASVPVQVTVPAPVSTFPYAQSFSSVTAPALPCGWDTDNVNADANTWVTYATSPITAPNTVSINRPANITSNDWLFSEGFSLQGGTTYRVSFDYKVSTAASEHLDVRFGTAQTVASMSSTPIISSTSLNSLTPVTLSGTFTPATSGTYFLGFHAKTPATTSAVRTYLDDIDLREAPTNDAEVQEIYTLGRLPIPFATPHIASASIYNAGVATLVGKQVTLTVTGPGGFSFTDTKTIASLAANASTTVAFTGYTPTVVGNYTVTVTVPADQDNSNNTKTMTQEVTANAYSYKYPGISNVTGVGVGFNNATGILAAKFFTSSTQEINQVKVDFLGSGQPYEIVILSANGAGGTPGTILYTSPTLTTAIGTALIPILPPVQVTGNFYIGVRQVGTTNYLFAFQEEVPLRANTFYSGNSAGTSWSPFSSRFRFAVEVELELPPTAPPNCTVYGTPAAGATGQGINGSLNFTSGGGGPTGFKVYLSSNQTAVTNEAASALVSDQVTLNYAYAGLSYGTVYYWKVVPYNSIGGATGCVVRQFTTRTIDLMANALISPGNKICYTNAEQVQVQIRNNAPSSNTIDFSQDPATVTVQVTTPSGPQTLTTTVNTGTLTSGSSLTVTLPGTLNMATNGNYTFNFTVNVAGDVDATNNALSPAVVVVAGPQNLPLAINEFNGFTGSNLTALYPRWFEGDGATTPVVGISGWTTGSTTQEAAFTEVAKLNLSLASDREWIISPQFRAAANTRLFWRAGITDAASVAADPAGMTGTDDAVMVMVSADCGVTWTAVYTYDAGNQPSNGSMSDYFYDLGAYANQNILVAFFATEGTVDDLPSYDFLLDAIEVRNVVALDLGVTALVTPGVQSCYSNAEPVKVIVRNFGTQALNFSANNTTVTVTVSRPGTSQTLTTTITNNAANGGVPLAPGDTMQVLVGNANMSVATTYTFNATSAIISGGTDGNSANNAMSPVTRTAPSLSATATVNSATVCQSGSPTLSLSSSSGVGSVQWQMAPNATGPFTNISGATTSPYTLTTPISQTAYFRARVSCGSNNVPTNVVTVTVNKPQITSTNSPVNSCGGNPVTLTATATGLGTGGEINWYEVATGGTKLHTGSSFTVTPAASKTYYAEASTGGATENVGIVNAAGSNFLTPNVGWGLWFNVTETTTIQYVHVYPTGTGTITIKVLDRATNAEVAVSAPVSITGSGLATKVQVPVNITLAPGSYKMGMASTGITNLIRESSGVSYPYTSPSGSVSIITGGNGTTSSTTAAYYWFYDWGISTGCRSARVPVQVNVIPTVTLPYGPVTFSGYDGTNLTTVYPNLSEGQGTTRPMGTTSDWTVSSASQQAAFAGETAKINLSSNSKREWIVGPRFTPTSTTRLNFETAVTGATTTDPAAMGSDDRVSAMISTDCGITFTALREFTAEDNLSNMLNFNSLSLSAYAGQSVIIAFYATDGVTDNTEDYDFHLDNVEIVNQVLAPLTGTYTINKAVATGNGTTGTNARNFRTLSDAMRALNERTVAGSVIFNVAANSGPYTERVRITNVVYDPGVATTAEITLNGNGNTVEAFLPRSVTSGYGVVLIDGTDRVTVSGLNITHSAASTRGWGVQLINDAQNIVIQNNVITVNATSTAARDFMGIVASANYSQYNFAGNNVTNLEILNNQITGGYEGIRINGNASAYSTGIVITGNTVTNAYKAGMFLQYLAAPVIGSATGTVAIPGNNIVTMRTGNVISRGLHLEDISGSVAVQRNRITNAGLYGLYMLRVNTNSAGSPLIANNMIGAGFQNGVEAAGILLNDVDNARVYFNSVNVDNANLGIGLDVYKVYSRNLDIRNNSLAYIGGGDGYAMRITVDSMVGQLNYNNYYSNGDNFVYYAKANRPTIDSLRNTHVFGPVVHDVNSRSGNPGYVSPTNLHSTGTQLSNVGQFIAAVTTEYDPAVTRTSTPDIGADERATGTRMIEVAGAASGALEVSAYPNPLPSGNSLQVRLSTVESGMVQLQLTDLVGRTVLQTAKSVEAGTTVQSLDMSTVSKGLYVLTVQQGSERQTLKVVVE